jgi:ankyrin repeat protein
MIDSKWDLANAVDTAGKTPLHRAAQLGNTGAIEKLLKAGVPINPVNTWMETPLHLAVRNGRAAAVKQLVDAGASKTAETAGGDTAYALATKYKRDFADLVASK